MEQRQEANTAHCSSNRSVRERSWQWEIADGSEGILQLHYGNTYCIWSACMMVFWKVCTQCPKSCHRKLVTHTHTHKLVKEESRVPANKYIHVGAGIRHLVDWLKVSTVRLHVYNEDGSNGLFRNAGIYQTTSSLILQNRNCKVTACPISEKTKFYTFTLLPCNRILNFSVRTSDTCDRTARRTATTTTFCNIKWNLHIVTSDEPANTPYCPMKAGMNMTQ